MKALVLTLMLMVSASAAYSTTYVYVDDPKEDVVVERYEEVAFSSGKPQVDTIRPSPEYYQTRVIVDSPTRPVSTAY